MLNKRLLKLRKDVFDANISLSESGLVVFTFGNVSGIDRQDNIVAIKPSGVDYNKLEVEDIVLIDIDGNKVDGKLNPSSDTETHLTLYREFAGIGGIVHTHSRFATSWAQAKRGLPCFGTTHADYFYGTVPCTDVILDKQIEKDYEGQTGNLIVRTFRDRGIDHKKIRACLVASHGPFVWAEDAKQAVEIGIILEEIARMNFYSVLLNPQLKSIKGSLLDKHYSRKHGKKAYYGQKN